MCPVGWSSSCGSSPDSLCIFRCLPPGRLLECADSIVCPVFLMLPSIFWLGWVFSYCKSLGPKAGCFRNPWKHFFLEGSNSCGEPLQTLVSFLPFRFTHTHTLETFMPRETAWQTLTFTTPREVHGHIALASLVSSSFCVCLVQFSLQGSKVAGLRMEFPLVRKSLPAWFLTTRSFPCCCIRSRWVDLQIHKCG